MIVQVWSNYSKRNADTVTAALEKGRNVAVEEEGSMHATRLLSVGYIQYVHAPARAPLNQK